MNEQNEQELLQRKLGQLGKTNYVIRGNVVYWDGKDDIGTILYLVSRNPSQLAGILEQAEQATQQQKQS